MVTLADIEREVASRLGPYRCETVASGTATTCVVAALQSSIELGDIEDLYLLRRSAAPADRQRIVKEYIPSTGTLMGDRSYTAPPAAGEVIELHHLDPAAELRKAVLAGLWRCYFMDVASAILTSAATERDLTALVAWITDPKQVYEVYYDYSSTYTPPPTVGWWKAYTKAGHVWLQVQPDPYPQTLYVEARRAVATWVKLDGTTSYTASTTGPTDDDDEVEVGLEYAAAAGHIEAWRRCAARLLPVAQTGLFPSQQVAAAAFEEMAKKHFHPPAKRAMMSEWFGLGARL